MASADLSAIGEGQAQFGKAVAELGSNVLELQTRAKAKDEAYDAELRFQEMQFEQEKALDQAMREVEPGQASGFHDRWIEENYKPRAQEFYQSLPDGLKMKYGIKTKQGERTLYGAAANFARGEQKRYSIATLDDQVANRFALSGDLDQAKADYDSLLSANPYLTPIEKDEVRRKHLDELEELNVQYRLNRGDDLEEVLRDLESGDLGAAAPDIGIETHADGMVTVSTGSGAKFRVSGDYAERFAGALADLEAAGIEVKADQSGGFSDRDIAGTKTPSQHKFGKAIDVNWTENARGSKGKIDPDVARGIASKWGLKWGGDWKNPDPMHFEIDPKATPDVGERGLTQVAGLKSKGQAADAQSDVERSDLPAISTPGKYPNLSPKRRAALVYRAKTSLSAQTQQDVDDDIERIRNTGQAPVDTEGRTSLDKASRLLTRNQLAAKTIKWQEAQMEYSAISPLPEMAEDEALEHLSSLIPAANLKGDSYASAVRVEEKANQAWRKIKELREKDPAAAVEGLPEVFEAEQQIARLSAPLEEVPGVAVENEAFATQQVMKLRIEARKEAQRRIGLREWEMQPITKAEADQLLDMPEPSSMEEGEYGDRLKLAANRADEVYGAEYGYEVLKAAISFQKRDNEEKLISSGILASMARGEAVPESEFRKMNQIIDIDRIGRVFDAPELEAERPAIAQPPSALPLGGQARREEGRAVTVVPNQGQTDWLMVDPQTRAKTFDREFGPGAAAKEIEKAAKQKAPPPGMMKLGGPQSAMLPETRPRGSAGGRAGPKVPKDDLDRQEQARRLRQKR